MHKLRKYSGVHVSSRKPTKKVCDEMKQEKKNDARVKMFLMGGSGL